VFIEAKDDGGGGDNWTTGAISRAKLQSNHHHQQTNIHCPSATVRQLQIFILEITGIFYWNVLKKSSYFLQSSLWTLELDVYISCDVCANGIFAVFN